MTTTNKHNERAELIAALRNQAKHEIGTQKLLMDAAALLEAQRPALKPLTDEQINDISAATYCGHDREVETFPQAFARAIIAEFCRINGITGEAQPAREWVGLTDVDRAACGKRAEEEGMAIMYVVEDMLREKNAGQPAADDKAGGEAAAWAKGYRQGVLDERESEANIGVAGFNAKIEPARENPYTHPQPQAEVRVPDGWKLVPVEPTDEMLRAIRNQRSGGRIGKGDRADWVAWLAAAPKPQATKEN